MTAIIDAETAGFRKTVWVAHHRRADIYLGLIPSLISNAFPGKVKDQINENYAHGGGYSAFGHSQWVFDPLTMTLSFPGDPVFTPKASALIGDERVIVYEAGVVAILQPDGSFEVTRMD